MQIYIKNLLGVTMCLSLISCAHTEKINFNPDKKFHYGKDQFLNYRTEGTGKKTMIFLHGFAASNRTWNDILPLLNGFDGRIIMFDLIGYGFSSKPRNGDYSFMANAAVISDFIDSNKIEDYVIVGHSFGGGVALMTTLNQLKASKYRPKGLILIDSAAYKVELPFFISYLKTPVLGYALLALTPPEIQAKHTLKKLYFDKNKVTKDKIARYAFFMKMKGHNNTLLKSARQIIPKNPDSITSRYKNIDIPVLVIWGKDDSALPVSGAYRLADDLPNSTLKIIEKCGHIPQEEYPRQTAENINRFLQSF